MICIQFPNCEDGLSVFSSHNLQELIGHPLKVTRSYLCHTYKSVVETKAAQSHCPHYFSLLLPTFCLFQLVLTVFCFFQLLSSCQIATQFINSCSSGSAKLYSRNGPFHIFCVDFFGLSADIQIVQNSPGETKCSKLQCGGVDRVACNNVDRSRSYAAQPHPTSNKSGFLQSIGAIL